ncbi:MAG: ATPase [Sphingobacteriales bacterium]|nr:MAG: ATPase [Sphingobacteriales bacterium]
MVVIGPESTGKSTLSEALAKELNTVWVPEYARGYLEQIGRLYVQNDLVEIAKGQLKSEDDLLAKANDYLICDTDLYVLKVWSEAKYGHCDKQILEEIAQRKYDLYLLTYIDIEWQDDPLREHPEAHERSYFYRQYLEIAQNSGVPWANIRGKEDERLQASLTAIKAIG